MSESVDQRSSAPELPEDDWLLTNIVGTANDSGAQFPMTLLVGGMLVSGMIIGGAEYFEEFAKQISPWFGGGESSDQLKQHYIEFGKSYLGKNRQGSVLPPPAYVHMKNARFYDSAGNGIPSNSGTLWRGKLTSVDGFFIGTFQKQ